MGRVQEERWWQCCSYNYIKIFIPRDPRSCTVLLSTSTLSELPSSCILTPAFYCNTYNMSLEIARHHCCTTYNITLVLRDFRYIY